MARRNPRPLDDYFELLQRSDGSVAVWRAEVPFGSYVVSIVAGGSGPFRVYSTPSTILDDPLGYTHYQVGVERGDELLSLWESDYEGEDIYLDHPVFRRFGRFWKYEGNLAAHMPAGDVAALLEAMDEWQARVKRGRRKRAKDRTARKLHRNPSMPSMPSKATRKKWATATRRMAKRQLKRAAFGGPLARHVVALSYVMTDDDVTTLDKARIFDAAPAALLDGLQPGPADVMAFIWTLKNIRGVIQPRHYAKADAFLNR